MKKGILLLLLLSSVFAHAQSLKDALYSGKLKNEPGTVIRKGDDLTSKMDTASKTSTDTTRKTPYIDTTITKEAPLTEDSSTKRLTIPTDSAVISTIANKDTITELTDTATASLGEAAHASKENVSAPKDNRVLWKEYMDSVTSTLKAEVLPSKKIKRGSYYVLVSYTIDTAGQVAIGDVFVSPENSNLQQQIKERLALDPPRLNPVLSSSGTPRKVTKKHNFTLSKE